MKTVPLRVARRFADAAARLEIQPLGNGLINDTYLVEAASGAWVLQRINAEVFPEPRRVVDNLLLLGRHIRAKPPATVRLRIPAIIPTRDGEPCYQDEHGQIWRALELISPAISREKIDNPRQAAEVGAALAHFHGLCSDLPADAMFDTLPGFHVTPTYYRHYLAVLDRPLPVVDDVEFRECVAFIAEHRQHVDVLESMRLRQRIIHGDPKLNNFLFHPDGNDVVSLIDLDTVKPGLVHYDIGDCLRSCCHLRDRHQFDLALCGEILKHYLREAGDFFTAADYDCLYAAIWLIPFELGLRFFSDYLAGDRYFKTRQPRQNLTRALAQFELCRDIARQRGEIEALVAAFRRAV